MPITTVDSTPYGGADKISRKAAMGWSATSIPA